MGLSVSRFRRTKTTIEMLERLENKIINLDKDAEHKEQMHKHIMKYLSVPLGTLYVLMTIIFLFSIYILYLNRNLSWFTIFLYSFVLMLLPMVFVLLRGLTVNYYKWSQIENKVERRKTIEEKQRLLQDVMYYESYEVAKPILEKYGTPEQSEEDSEPLLAHRINMPDDEHCSEETRFKD